MVENEIPMNIEDLLNRIMPEQKRKALAKAGTLVQNEAKERCKVDTGILRNSISYVIDDGDSYSIFSSEGTGKNKTLIEQSSSVGGDGSTVTIGTNVEYAHYHHNKNPFLRDAIDQNLDGIRECLTFTI